MISGYPPISVFAYRRQVGCSLRATLLTPPFLVGFFIVASLGLLSAGPLAPTQAWAIEDAPGGQQGRPVAGESAAGVEGHHEASHEEHPELPNLIHLLYKAMGGPEGTAPRWMEILHRFQDLFFALLVAGLICLVVRLGTRQMTMVPGPMQNVIEAFVDGFRNLIVGMLGPKEGNRYAPFLGTLFLYIWGMNLFGLFPLMKSPTAVLSTTAALAICVFCYVQYTGIRRLGPLKYLGHLAGDPQDPMGWALVILMFPLHVIGECAKPVSLSLRLFGNIMGEDALLGVFAMLGVAILAFMKLPIGIPLHLPFILLALLMSTVQALVFTLLATSYIMQMLPHEHEEETEAA
ncbi:MAG: F0F1 ATP synthase subunit A [Candidatus Eisenbacteria sp.]|nr:F0F1 ATP synthase subunit A [Candidatus Eisenbacteria bacterium]